MLRKAGYCAEAVRRARDFKDPKIRSLCEKFNKDFNEIGKGGR